LIGVNFSSLLLISLLFIVIKISEVDATTRELIATEGSVSVGPACAGIVASMSTFAAIGSEIILVALLAAMVGIVVTARIVVVIAEVVSTKILLEEKENDEEESEQLN
jgi:putative effector of murein hydrolase LrgA (UPF0299 family)